MTKTKQLIFLSLLTCASPLASPPAGAAPAAYPAAESLSYADIADLVTASPLVIRATVKSVSKVASNAATAQSSPVQHVYVTASVDALIRGDGGVTPMVSFLAEQPVNGGKWRRRQAVMLFARAGARPGEIQLVSRNAMRPTTERLESESRAIATELLKTNAPPAITGIGDAFHVAGTVAGEGETQIFLKTDSGAPVSLSIVRRPGQAPQWGASLGEIVDESAVAPTPGHLLWYRLACALPARLPESSTRTLPLLDAEAARRDFRFVLESLGSCGRTL